jgi:hypothetical protein
MRTFIHANIKIKDIQTAKQEVVPRASRSLFRQASRRTFSQVSRRIKDIQTGKQELSQDDSHAESKRT